MGAPSVAPLGVAGLAALTRLLRALFDDTLFNDGPRFVRNAEAVVRGDWGAALSDAFHPLASVLMAAVHAATGLDLETAGSVVSVASGPLAAVAIYYLVRDTFGERTAVLSGVMVAIHPRLVAASYSVQSDGLHLALVLAGAWAAWRALSSRRVAPAAAAGVATGLAYLTRPEGLIVAPVLAAWLLRDALTRRTSWSRAAGIGVAFALAAGAVVAPYLVSLRLHTGDWTLTQKKAATEILSLGATPGSVAASDGDGAIQRLAAAIAELATDGYRAAKPAFFYVALLGFERGRPRRLTLYLLSFAALMTGVLLGLHLHASYVSRRHWLIPVTFLLPYAARGAQVAMEWLAAQLRFTRVRRAATVGLVLVCGLGFGVSAWPREAPAKSARREAALWLAAHAPPGAVAASRQRLAYYSGATRFVRVFGQGDSLAVTRDARRRGADYLLIEEGRLGLPGVRTLPGVTLLHQVDHPGGTVLVLKIERSPPAP